MTRSLAGVLPNDTFETDNEKFTFIVQNDTSLEVYNDKIKLPYNDNGILRIDD